MIETRVDAARLDTPLGPMVVRATDRGIVCAGWGSTESATTDRGPAADAACQLGEYFAGVRRVFDLPIDFDAIGATEFQAAAWRGLLGIPFGETRTYGEQAARLGNPAASRAVGAANGANPVAVIIPCHRVIASDGTLHGYTGGVEKKRWLLDHERATLWK